MSTETPGVSPTPVEAVETNLDDFSTEFFGRNKEKAVDQPEVKEKPVEELDAELNESQSEEEDLHDDSSEDLEAAKPKKKNSAQERIAELTRKLREAERQRDELVAPKPKPAEPAKVEAKTESPTPLDLKEDGSEKYPLGEFDPAYIKDLVAHTLKEERQAAKAYEEQAAAQQTLEAQKNALDESWKEKLEPAQERYPDFVEKGQSLAQTFEHINPAYGEYLVATIKSMEYGTDVLYYLANHPDEAQKIVDGGPARATVALGRLEARFVKDDDEPEVRVKTTKAPEPPKVMNKGNTVAKPVQADTDDLDEFSRVFYDKRRKH